MASLSADQMRVNQERVIALFVVNAVMTVAKDGCRSAAVDRLYYSTLAKGRIET